VVASRLVRGALAQPVRVCQTDSRHAGVDRLTPRKGSRHCPPHACLQRGDPDSDYRAGVASFSRHLHGPGLGGRWFDHGANGDGWLGGRAPLSRTDGFLAGRLRVNRNGSGIGECRPLPEDSGSLPVLPTPDQAAVSGPGPGPLPPGLGLGPLARLSNTRSGDSWLPCRRERMSMQPL
jgi:hypothetical protein